jgi:hypothetical protein
MAQLLRVLALICFVLAAAAAINARTAATLGRVPWLPIGLGFWVWAELIDGPDVLEID